MPSSWLWKQIDIKKDRHLLAKLYLKKKKPFYNWWMELKNESYDLKIAANK